ncbi:hypothetical protein [Oligella urethralis]|uniref:Uncharacterized protein n=1 Tax=Oligella urethralis TaxID=90245 RepID=A0A2N6QF94_9BURK|nr:hypothetical protein [Oligella urethralis]PMC18235.1 hypothetical protein CJ230_03775 [Oligella urethralis]SPY09094.1 Uncharacterised protein [Oligella urethralis]SUA61275.1 Uncharacterised protein [Oligella urethralis]
MKVNRTIQHAIVNERVHRGWSALFVFYALAFAGVIGQLLNMALEAMGFSEHIAYIWFVGLIMFVAALWFILRYPIAGLIMGAIITLQLAVSMAYLAYGSYGFGGSLVAFTVTIGASLIMHHSALEDLKNTTFT